MVWCGSEEGYTNVMCLTPDVMCDHNLYGQGQFVLISLTPSSDGFLIVSTILFGLCLSLLCSTTWMIM